MFILDPKEFIKKDFLHLPLILYLFGSGFPPSSVSLRKAQPQLRSPLSPVDLITHTSHHINAPQTKLSSFTICYIKEEKKNVLVLLQSHIIPYIS